MKTTIIHEKNNPFVTFALRGGRLRKCGRGVVSYAPFLMVAVSAVALGSMLALSTPSFADEDDDDDDEMVVCSNMDSSIVSAAENSTDNYAGVFLTSPITVTGRKDMDMATGQDMKTTVMATDYYSSSSSKFYTDNDGFYKTMITTSMATSGAADANGGTGVRFYRVGDGTICLDNNADISGAGYGIRASHNGMGVLGISNEGDIMNAVQDGISAIRSGNGDINIDSSGEEISANVAGIYAKHTNEGGINIENSSQITVTSTSTSMKANGIEMKHTGEGNISIENSFPINARDAGIDALHTGAGNRNIGITLKSGSNVLPEEKVFTRNVVAEEAGKFRLFLRGEPVSIITLFPKKVVALRCVMKAMDSLILTSTLRRKGQEVPRYERLLKERKGHTCRASRQW